MSSPRLRVSIVIPTYNEEFHLRSCLQAIADQSEPVHEVIVVDNNSTDHTAEVAAAYPFVRVVTERRQGRAFARNAGFDTATGDIIGRIDADIILPRHWVAHVRHFYANPNHWQSAWSGAGYFYNARLPRLVSFAYGLLAFRFNKLLLGHYTLWGSNMALTRQQWLAVRTETCDRLDIHEDLDLAIHLHGHNFAVTYDTKLKTNAELRRVHSNRHELWDYLQWWPRTLQIHDNKFWGVCWLFGALFLYWATFILLLADKLAGGPKSAEAPARRSVAVLESDLR